jgi:hypothetical protein
MSWSYRIIRYHDGSHALHEVHYDDNDKDKDTKDRKVIGWTKLPIDFAAWADEGSEGIIASLKNALDDAMHLPVFVAPLDDDDFSGALGPLPAGLAEEVLELKDLPAEVEEWAVTRLKKN